MSVCLGKSHILLRELLSLREGDVVPLQTRVGEQFVAPIQGVPKFKGRIGVKGKRLAFQVMELMES
jgi:flagellar motor switch protein FliM